ncbi:terminase large subunit [Mammaliicoccus vitulinus]|uniref:terminase large subunit n=1 Tax=Mammaliicoccus vitulinus TaxID=71237 RepID=UPI00186718FB|nr:terminase TerL endonuclease subunit [Mammaliicoccus vitulinus]
MVDNFDYVTDYARKVYKGDIVASNKNIKACERHLKNMNLKTFKYYFNVEKANKIINFLEMLPDPKSGEPMKLASFQKFIVGSLYGWVDDLGNRRFTKAYISKARKNGKSLIVSGLGLYELLFGDNPKNERFIAFAANSKDQSKIAYEMTQTQLESIRYRSNAIKEITKIVPSRNEITNLRDRSKAKPLSKETSNLDGYQISFGILDEYHEAKDNKMIEVIRSGQVLLNNPFLGIISTAGFHLNGPMYKEYEYITKILNGNEINDNYFIYVAEQDNENEVHDKNTWIKSNPLLEVEELKDVLMRNLRNELNEAIQKQDMNGVLVKNFNLWQQASKDSYISFKDWQECYTESKLDLKGRDVYIGIDLSRADDLTAIGFIYPLEGKKYFVDSHVFVGTKRPIQEKSKQDKIDYMQLVNTEMATLTDTDSGVINYEQVVNYLTDFIETNQLNVKAICYDSWNAQAVIAKMENETDYMLVDVPQGYKHMSPALKQFRLDVFEKKIKHNNNPNLNLAINNAINKFDNNGNIILDKQTNRNKIDAIVALVTAYTMAMTYEFESSMEDYILSDDFGF